MEGPPRVKGIHTVRIVRKGKPVLWYIYAWRGGPCILRKEGGTRPVIDDAALARLAAARAARSRATDQTLAWLAECWRKSPEWRGMANSTRLQWGYKLTAIEREFGDAPLAAIDNTKFTTDIFEWRDRLSDKPRAADYAVQVLSALLGWGVKRRHLKHNAATGVNRLYKAGQRAHIIWEEDEREIWKKARPARRIAFEFACLTGLRRGDLCAVPWEAVKRSAIVWQPAKAQGEITVTIPIIAPLRKLLDSIRPEDATGPILRSEAGRPWTLSGLSHAIRDEAAALGLPPKHLHDCRGTYATELCLAGVTDRDIADILGWSPTRVATIRRVYVDSARTVVAIGDRASGVK